MAYQRRHRREIIENNVASMEEMAYQAKKAAAKNGQRENVVAKIIGGVKIWRISMWRISMRLRHIINEKIISAAKSARQRRRRRKR
jgi:hypothetical protein